LGDKDKPVLLIEHAEKCIDNFKNQLEYIFKKTTLEDVLSINLMNQILTILVKTMKGKSQINTKKYSLLFIK
jgi:hypothetical protein